MYFGRGGYVAHFGGEARYIKGFGSGNERERGKLEDPGLSGRIILRWIFRKWDMGARTGLIWLGIDTVGEHW
jgi:hypothetical protein